MNGNRNTKTVRKAGNRGRYLWIGGILSGFMVLLILISFFWTPYGTTAMDAAVSHFPKCRFIAAPFCQSQSNLCRKNATALMGRGVMSPYGTL